jgi:ribonucleoside-triphosphate reductase
MIYVVKKDGTREKFNVEKIISAVNKSAARILYTFTEDEKRKICDFAFTKAESLGRENIDIQDMHNIVEGALEQVNPSVARSYRDYRNYKKDFVHMMDDVYTKSQSIRYIGDKSNANTDSALVATKRSLIFNELNKELYRKFFMNRNELQACRDGYIYIHDQSARLDTMNCCLFDVGNVLKGGFEMGNVWYNEPKTLDTAFDVMGDIILSTAAQQYGGFTVPEVDKILAPYAEKSYEKYKVEFKQFADPAWPGLDEKAEHYALSKVRRDFDQGWQGIEYKLNTVGSSRGDYPFVTVTLGLGTKQFEKMCNISLLQVHKQGQGKSGNKKPVLFPKIVFLYDEEIHGPGKCCEDVFEEGVDCSSKTMYPDWLSMSGKGYIASMYKRYKKVISPMGCRAFLSPWYERGGMHPADENDTPVFVGRFNIGAVSLHLPMILAKSRAENRD